MVCCQKTTKTGTLQRFSYYLRRDFQGVSFFLATFAARKSNSKQIRKKDEKVSTNHHRHHTINQHGDGADKQNG